jgi:hypothetical protein
MVIDLSFLLEAFEGMRVFEVNPEDFLPQWGWLQ